MAQSVFSKSIATTALVRTADTKKKQIRLMFVVYCFCHKIVFQNELTFKNKDSLILSIRNKNLFLVKSYNSFRWHLSTTILNTWFSFIFTYLRYEKAILEHPVFLFCWILGKKLIYLKEFLTRKLFPSKS